MGADITFDSDPEIKHINLRKEGDDGEVIAVDLKIEGSARIGPKGELIQRLLGCEESRALAFWYTPDNGASPDPDENPESEIAFSGMTSITSWAQFEHKHQANIGGLTFRPTKIGKFSLTPRAGYVVDLVFQVSISDITERQLNILIECLRTQVPMEFKGDPELFDEEEPS